MSHRTTARVAALLIAVFLLGLLTLGSATGNVGWTFYTPTNATLVESEPWPLAAILGAIILVGLVVVWWAAGRIFKR